MKFTIHTDPRTKKNSSQIFVAGNRHFVAPSKAYKSFESDCLRLIPGKYKCAVESPVNLKGVFYMGTKRKVDLCNLLSALCDVLVVANVIADDNSGIVVSHDGSRVFYDKINPRIEVEITEVI